MMIHENNRKHHRCQLMTSHFLVIKFRLLSEAKLLGITSVVEYSNRIEIKAFQKSMDSVNW